jgi:hypothetical protein
VIGAANTRGQPTHGGNDERRLGEIARHVVGHALTIQHPFCFVAVVDKDGLAADFAARFDVVEYVAYEPRLRQVYVKFACGAKDGRATRTMIRSEERS